MSNASIVIPAYQPGPELNDLVTELLNKKPLLSIIVVNDGSSPQHQPIFDHIKSQNCSVLDHPINKGKGAALQTAFNFWLQNFANIQAGLVTADADGQHHVDDILMLADELIASPNYLHLGVRQFADQHIPWRSQMGNKMTARLFKWFAKSKLDDTQTGLRGINEKLIHLLNGCRETGYDFELEMLMTACRNGIQIKQHSIKTIYFEGNPSSHFHPVLDSIKVYRVFWKHLFKK